MATLPIYTTRPARWRRCGRDQDDPAGSLRHVDQNIETAYAHFYGVSFQRQLGQAWLPASSTGFERPQALRPGGSQQAGSAAGLPRRRVARRRGRTRGTRAFNTRGNRGQSQYHGVTFGLDPRQLGHIGLQLSARYTLGHAKDNLSNTFSERLQQFQSRLSRRVRSDARLGLGASSTSGTASRSPGSGFCRSGSNAAGLARRWQPTGSSTGS